MKKLSELLQAIQYKEIIGSEEVMISQIEFDSRKIKKEESHTANGIIYVAQRGLNVDGHDFIDAAIANGASVIVVEMLPENLQNNVTYIKVDNSSVALGRLASAFYDFPSKKIKLVGITGTNGKTTIATLLHKLFIDLGYPTGLISTITNKIINKEFPTTYTTPDALQLNKLLSEMVNAGCEFCFMEVSSHAVCQHRIEGVEYICGVFTNITHDHLDFHKTFDQYIKAKKSFFDNLAPTAFAITNIDDRNGEVMVQNTKAKIFTYGLQTAATVKGKIIENHFEGLSMNINEREVFFKLCGRFNAYNLLAIYATVSLLLTEEDEKILAVMSNLESASGRFQLIYNDKGSVAIIDYAHTPDALKNVLSTIQDINNNSSEVITVVGCGGDRDALKRPLMAEIACDFSNKVILTSDNPRTEDPLKILSDMEKGVPVSYKKNVLIIENRKEAIKTACMMLSPGGVLLVAGKGHETYQEINHVRHPFDDREVVKEFL